MGMNYTQPIIRGIEAVGAVRIRYKYNGNGGKMTLPSNLMRINNMVTADANTINTENFVDVAGFRLDSNFLRANPQIASSFMIPILGGGAIALTNNNRSGTLNINCTRVSTPNHANGTEETKKDDKGNTIITYGASQTEPDSIGAMYKPAGLSIGPLADEPVYDLVFLAQVQQAQVGGDSQGSTIQVAFDFCGLTNILEFQGCTIASVDPLGLSGNDAVDYGVAINYLNWTCDYSDASGNLANAISM